MSVDRPGHQFLAGPRLSGDEDRARLRVGDHRRVDQRLVVDEFIRLARLYLVIENQAEPEGAGSEDLDDLVGALSGIQGFIDPVQHGEVRRQVVEGQAADRESQSRAGHGKPAEKMRVCCGYDIIFRGVPIRAAGLPRERSAARGAAHDLL